MKKLSAKEYRVQREKYLASLSPEEREELERKKREAEAVSRKRRGEFFKWLEDGMKTNEHHEKAIKVLLETLRTTANHKDMTPEIKDFTEALILVIEDRKLFEYDLEAIMHPLIEIVGEDTKSKAGRHAGRFPKKPEGRTDAIILWKDWRKDPTLFKNKTKFCAALKEKRYCDTPATAGRWVEAFRCDYPSATLEKILPKRK